MLEDSKLHTIVLYGSLGEKFTTEPIELYGSDLKSIFQGLISRFGDEFTSTILNGAWHVITGKPAAQTPTTYDSYIGEDELLLPIGSDELHIFPAVVGEGNNVGKIIVGVVLIVVAVVLIWFTPALLGAGATSLSSVAGTGITAGQLGATLGAAGISAAAGGIAGMIAKSPTLDSSNDPARRASFLFNGAVNNTEQGVPVPLVYGRHYTGSTVISASVATEQLFAPGSISAAQKESAATTEAEYAAYVSTVEETDDGKYYLPNIVV